MTTWISLSVDALQPLLSPAQREAFLVRPNQGSSSDPFIIAAQVATQRIREAILNNPLNQLSENTEHLPPEHLQTAAILCLQSLESRLLGFTLTEKHDDLIDQALDRLIAISRGDLPVSIPDNPRTTPFTSRSVGVALLSYRKKKIKSDELSGL
ncbi:MAG: hypothetical protein AAFX93_15195 [Verrucomicrobiota bacterium]